MSSVWMDSSRRLSGVELVTMARQNIKRNLKQQRRERMKLRVKASQLLIMGCLAWQLAAQSQPLSQPSAHRLFQNQPEKGGASYPRSDEPERASRFVGSAVPSAIRIDNQTAIQMVKSKLNGHRILNARLRSAGGTPQYQIKVLSPEGVVSMIYVDAATGRISD